MKLTTLNWSFGNYKQTRPEADHSKGSFVKGKAENAWSWPI